MSFVDKRDFSYPCCATGRPRGNAAKKVSLPFHGRWSFLHLESTPAPWPGRRRPPRPLSRVRTCGLIRTSCVSASTSARCELGGALCAQQPASQRPANKCAQHFAAHCCTPASPACPASTLRYRPARASEARRHATHAAAHASKGGASEAGRGALLRRGARPACSAFLKEENVEP